MVKKPMSWIDVTTMVIKERKAKGLEPGLKPAIPEAKKIWAEIKKGTHPKFSVGKPKTRKRKSKKSKSNKSKSKKSKKQLKIEGEEETKKVKSKKSKSKKSRKSKKK